MCATWKAIGRGFAVLALAALGMNLAHAALAPVHRDAAKEPPAGTSTPNVLPLPDAQVGQFYAYNVALGWTCTTNPNPVFAFTWSPPSPVPGLSFPSGGQISGTPTTAGSYSAPGTVVDVSGLTGACTAPASFTYTLTVRPRPPVCSVSASNLNPGVNTNITLTASCSNSPTSYSWTGCSSTTSTCTTTSATSGARSYTVNATNAGGTGSASVTVNWIGPPNCSVSSSNNSPGINTSITLTASCSGSPTSYAWTNCTSTTSTCTTTSSTAGSRTYSVVGSNAGGAGNTAQVTVTWVLAVPTCTLSAPSTAQVGSSALLSASCTNNPTSFAWSGCTSSGSTCATSSTTPGIRNYGVTATNAAGAGPQATAQITWVPSTVPVCTPSASNANPTVGTSITIGANCTNSPTSYAWTGCSSTGATCSDTRTTEGTRTYAVTGTNASGSGSGSVTVTWKGEPTTSGGGGGVVGAASGGGGSGFSALIRDSGTLWTWGDNSQSGLGDGSSTSRSTPGQVSGLTNIKAATVGSASHTLALDKDGKVFAWGTNTYGEIGNGTRSPQLRPALVPLPYPAAAVAAGAGFSLALLQNGTLYAWGRNDVGQLGDGSGADQLSPVAVNGLSGITSIAASGNHAAVAAGGYVYVWGGSFYVAPNQSPRAVQVPNLAGVVAVFAGGDNTFALKSDGTLWGFGNPADGRLGNGGDSDGKSPVQVRGASGPLGDVQAVAAGDSVSMALLGDGSLVGWGKNDRGQLGLGHMNVVTTAAKLTLPASAAIANAAAGPSNFVVDAKGRMFAAGSNERGSLGLGDTVETRAPATVRGLAAITAVAVTPTESIALRSDGVVLSWGSADNSTALASTATPRAVPGLAGRYIAIAGGSQTAAAVRDDGAVFGWGASVPGVSAAPVTSAVAIAGLTNAKSVASGGLGVIALTNTGRALIACGKPGCPGADFGFTDVTAVAAGETHFLVLRADKSVWAWGANDKGQLGNGGTSPASSPVRVSNLANVRSIAAGADFAIAVRDDNGYAFAWGLAPSFATVRTVPTRISGLDGAATLAAASHVLALDGSGRGRAWGKGTKVGERDHLSPGREPRMDGMKALAAGVNHSLGVASDGQVVAWGRNFNQQLAVPRSQAIADFVEVIDPANSAYTQGASQVVEFVNPAIAMGGKSNLTHYFMTAYADEINALDTGANVKGWQRTGRAWRAWQIDASGAPVAGAPASAKPVYRFFSSRWNSHFYTAVAAEKDALIAKNPTQDDTIDWKLESVAFYSVTPDSSCPALSVLPRSPYLCTDTPTPAARDCPAGYYPIYRAFDIGPTSTRPDPNHQFTSSWVDIYRNVRFAGYVYEGVAFCAPIASQPGGDLQAYHTYPGDKVDASKPMQSEFWFANAGPGNADKAVLVAALPANAGNWTATCRAYNGATCPADLGVNALRLGVEAPSLPAGGVVHITGVGTSPPQGTTLSFASSIGAPSGAPDPFGSNNASPVTETVVDDGACGITLSAKSLALVVEGASASVLVDAPAACTWSIASDQSWATITPSSGTGRNTVRIAAAANGDPADRLATVTVSAGARTSPVEVRQPGIPAALPCPSIALGRLSDIIGGNAMENRVNVVAPSNCAWQASTSDSWLAVSAMSALGTGQIEYVVQPNFDTANGRTGSIVVTGAGKALHVLTVTQASGNSGSDQGGGDGGDGGGGGGGGPGGDGGDGGGDGAGE